MWERGLSKGRERGEHCTDRRYRSDRSWSGDLENIAAAQVLVILRGPLAPRGGAGAAVAGRLRARARRPPLRERRHGRGARRPAERLRHRGGRLALPDPGRAGRRGRRNSMEGNIRVHHLVHRGQLLGELESRNADAVPRALDERCNEGMGFFQAFEGRW